MQTSRENKSLMSDSSCPLTNDPKADRFNLVRVIYDVLRGRRASDSSRCADGSRSNRARMNWVKVIGKASFPSRAGGTFR